MINIKELWISFYRSLPQTQMLNVNKTGKTVKCSKKNSVRINGFLVQS